MDSLSDGSFIKILCALEYRLMNIELRKKNEAGTIVLIAVMIMATLLTAALGTGTLVINIVNQSASIDYSISAYYSAETGIEKGLYRIRKDNYIPPIKEYTVTPDVEDSNIGDQLTLDASATLKFHYDMTTINGKDSIIFDLVANQEYEVDLYNPNLSASLPVDPVELNISGRGNPDTEVTIQITAISWSGNELEVPNAVVRTIPQGDAAIDPPIVLNLAAAHVHKVKFKVFGGSLENIIITAYDGGGASVSMPGTYVLTSTGSYPYGTGRQASQILSVEMPILEPAYGLYNFVIFSEGDITKSVNW